jgi:hypothetical protein
VGCEQTHPRQSLPCLAGMAVRPAGTGRDEPGHHRPARLRDGRARRRAGRRGVRRHREQPGQRRVRLVRQIPVPGPAPRDRGPGLHLARDLPPAGQRGPAAGSGRPLRARRVHPLPGPRQRRLARERGGQPAAHRGRGARAAGQPGRQPGMAGRPAGPGPAPPGRPDPLPSSRRRVGRGGPGRATVADRIGLVPEHLHQGLWFPLRLTAGMGLSLARGHRTVPPDLRGVRPGPAVLGVGLPRVHPVHHVPSVARGFPDALRS